MRVRLWSLGIALSLTFTTAGSALAACGIGSKIWEGSGMPGARVVAFTTNFWTFKGISTTFEILGCTEKDNIFKKVASAKVHDYASNNFDRLASDMARGDGEYLDAFASLLQVEASDRAEFKAFTQLNLEHLVPRDDVTVEEFLAELGRRMVERATLSRYLEG